MPKKELKNKDSEKELAPILLQAPEALHGCAEKEQSGSGAGIESVEGLKEEALEGYDIPRAYAQCC